METNITESVNRSSPVPVYHQIEQDLKYRIIRHEWDLDERLPSENDLSEQYHVSRLTLRQALRSLEQQKIIRRQRGSGTYINADISKFVTSLNYVMISRDQVGGEANKITATVLEKRLISAAPQYAYKRLQLKENSSVVFIKRVYFRGDIPLAVSRSYVNAEFVPGMESVDLINNSVAQTLEDYFHLYPQRIDDYIEGFRSNQEDCALLRCDTDTPLILIESTTYLTDEVPLDTTATVWVGDIARFHLQLLRGKNGYEINNSFTNQKNETDTQGVLK